MSVTTMFLLCAICSPFLNYLGTMLSLNLLSGLPGDEALRSAASMRSFYKKFYIVMTVLVAVYSFSTESFGIALFKTLAIASIYITVDPMMNRLTARLRAV